LKSARFFLPFAIASSLFAAALLLLIRHGLHQDAGVFVYPLDDAYIHLAVSRNLALHGVWGISPYAFSGASSSPGWTLLLAFILRVAGVHVLTPLVLNAIAAVLLLLVANLILARALPRASIAFLTTALCVLVLIVPLPGLAMVGMEHTLHSLAMLCLIATAAWIASLPESEAIPSSAAIALLLLSAISGAVRYESCFGVGIIMAVLLLRRRGLLALLAGAASAIGPVGYGIYSYRHTGLYLPFSVLMKSAGHGTHNSLDGLLTSSVAPILLLMAIALLIRLAQRELTPSAERGPFWTYGQSFLILVLGTLLLHDLVGPTGWLMRYEAYLYVLGLVAIALAVGEAKAGPAVPVALQGATKWAALALLVAALPLGLELLHRAHHGYSDVAASIHDRYVEHLSQAQFVGDAFPNSAVIANDIGFLAFYAPDAKILDPLGLGSIEPVRLLRAHQPMSPAFMQQWGAKENAKLAILHTDFPGMDMMIPTGWVLVESWCFPHNLVFLNHVESFYAPDASAADTLRTKLAAFHGVSPEIVRYRLPHDGTTPPSPARGETAVCPVP
jgi:hypothetical protein